jgi:hypothetical protein
LDIAFHVDRALPGGESAVLIMPRMGLKRDAKVFAFDFGPTMVQIS